MEDEVKTTQTEEQTPITADDYLTNLTALRNATVSKDEYERLKEENRKLADALANGLPYERNDEPDKVPVDIDALRKKLYVDHKYDTNIEFFTDLLTLRAALIEKGDADPFLPTNPEYIPNDNDSDRAQFIADEIQAAIDYAEGSNEVFNVELQRRCGVNKKR